LRNWSHVRKDSLPQAVDDSTPDLQAALDRALARIDELEAENARLRERLQELEHKLGRNSSNSHRPPSTDDPWEEAPEDAAGGEDIDSEGSGQYGSCQQGAQPGHEGHHRGLLDEEEVESRSVRSSRSSQASAVHVALVSSGKTGLRDAIRFSTSRLRATLPSTRCTGSTVRSAAEASPPPCPKECLKAHARVHLAIRCADG
jgi:hypothetical protein